MNVLDQATFLNARAKLCQQCEEVWRELSLDRLRRLTAVTWSPSDEDVELGVGDLSLLQLNWLCIGLKSDLMVGRYKKQGCVKLAWPSISNEHFQFAIQVENVLKARVMAGEQIKVPAVWRQLGKYREFAMGVESDFVFLSRLQKLLIFVPTIAALALRPDQIDQVQRAVVLNKSLARYDPDDLGPKQRVAVIGMLTQIIASLPHTNLEDSNKVTLATQGAVMFLEKLLCARDLYIRGFSDDVDQVTIAEAFTKRCRGILHLQFKYDHPRRGMCLFLQFRNGNRRRAGEEYTRQLCGEGLRLDYCYEL